MTDTRSLTYRQNQTSCHVPIKFADQFYIRFNCNCKMPVTLKSLIVDVHNNASKAYNSQADCHRFIIIIRVQRIQCLKPTIQQLAIKSCNPAISHSSLSLKHLSTVGQIICSALFQFIACFSYRMQLQNNETPGWLLHVNSKSIISGQAM